MTTKTKTVSARRTSKQPTKETERAVVVTTAHRGVFFGYATNTEGETITLRGGRLCLYWTAEVRGFMGLAATGPSKGCRVGPPVRITLRNVTAVLECSPVAIKAWERGPWD